MPPGETIDSIFDEQAMQKQIANVSSGLQTIINQMLALQKIGEDLAAAPRVELPGAEPKARAALAEMQKAQNQLNQALSQENVILQKLRIQTQQFADTKKKETEETNKQFNAQKDLNAEYKKATQLVYENEKAYGNQSQQFKDAANNAFLLKKRIDEINEASKKGVAAAVMASPAPAVVSTDNLAQLEAEQQAAEKTGVAVSDLEAQEAAGVVSANEWAAAQTGAAEATSEGAAATEQAARAYAEFNTELQENIAIFVENDIAIKANRSEQAILQKAIKQSGAATTEQTAKLVQLTEEEAVLKQTNRDLNTTIQATVKEQTAAAGSTEQLRARIAALTQQYNQLSAAERASAEGLKVKGELTQTTAALATAEGAAKKTTGAIGALGKGFSFLKTAAFLIPGLGIAGIFNLIFEGATAAYKSIIQDNEAVNRFKDTLKALNDVVSDANKDAGKQIADLKILYHAATDVNLSMSDRLAAVTALKSEFPEYFKAVGDETILNGDAKKSYDALTTSIIQASRATAAKAKLEDIEKQRLDIDFQKRKIIAATNAEKARAKDELQSGNSIVGGLSPTISDLSTKQTQVDIVESRKRIALKKEEQKATSLDMQEKFLIAFVGEKKITKVVEDEHKNRNSSSKEDVKDFSKDLLEAQKTGNDLSLSDEIKFNQSIAESDEFGLQQRVMSAKQASKLRIQLIKEDADAETQINKVQQSNALEELNKQESAITTNIKLAADKRSALLAEIDKQRKNAQDAFAQERANIDKKADIASKEETLKTITELGNIYKQERDKLNKLVPPPPPEPIDTTQDAFDKRFEIQKHSLEQQAVVTATFYADEQNKLDIAHRQGLLSDKEYQEKTVDNQKAAIAKQVDNLKQQINSLFAQNSDLQLKRNELSSLLNISEIVTPGDIDGENKLKEQIEGLGDAITKNNDAINKSNEGIVTLQGNVVKLGETKLDKLHNAFETIADIVNKVSEVIGEAFTNSLTKQKNALQTLEDQQEVNYEAAVDRVNSSTENEQDKANELIALDGKRQAEKEKNARSDRKIAHDQAVFDKIANIGRIVTTGALLILDSFLKFGPAGLIAAGALVGAELAVAATAPIPSYKDLTEYHPGGLGQVFDRPDKKPEIVTFPTGERFAGNKSTVMNMPAGTTVRLLEKELPVITDEEINRMLWVEAMRNTAALFQQRPSEQSSNEMTEANKYLRKIAGKKNITNVIVTIPDNSWVKRQIKD